MLFLCPVGLMSKSFGHATTDAHATVILEVPRLQLPARECIVGQMNSVSERSSFSRVCMMYEVEHKNEAES